MATPVPSKSFLTSKMGPFPVWGWAGGTLGLAYAYSRYKANKTATAASKSSTSTTAYVPGTGAVGEPAVGAPTFLIENNLPPGPTAPPSTPVPPPTPAPPAVTPPGTTPSPPTNVTPPPAVGPGTGLTIPPSRIDRPPTPAAPPPPAPPARNEIPGSTYRVQHGDTLSSIAAHYGIPGGWQALWAYQLDPRNNPPEQIATLRQRGPNLLFAGETIRIPAHY